MHDANRGVGAAFLTGMRYAIERGADIIVKIDADGQMDPSQVAALIHPIVSGQADYVKGDRFFFLGNAASMPSARLFGNLVLSFLTKLSSGYWTIMDPTNGFLAIHARVAELLDDQQIAKRFFFETDLLFHLGLIRAKVVEFPIRTSSRRFSPDTCAIRCAGFSTAIFFVKSRWRRFSLSPAQPCSALVLCSDCTIGGRRRRISWCRPELS
jgi:glycosyltransferase involved in cell wall biosynthesis